MAGLSRYLTAIVSLIAAKGGRTHKREGGRASRHATNEQFYSDLSGVQQLYASCNQDNITII